MDYLLLVLFKFKLYIIAMIAAIFAGGVRAASNNDTLLGYGFCFVFVGQFTDFVYLRAATMLEGFADKYSAKINGWKEK